MLETLVTLTMYVESNCTKYDFPTYQQDKCYVLSEEAREGIKDYWDDYGIGIEFVDLKQRRANIYRPRMEMKAHDKYMKGLYDRVVESNDLELGKNDYVVIMSAGLPNTFGFATFKHNIFQVDNRQPESLQVVVDTFNHEMGHTIWGWKHTEDTDNLMNSHAETMTDNGLNKNQKQDLARMIKNNSQRRACSVNPRFGCPCGNC